MTLKYASKQKIFAYVLLSLIYACGNIAIAYVTKIMLNLAILGILLKWLL